ncbi:hypothetical protein ACFPJ1_13310 [Kribbella qitaiheensis]|uniref:beta-xylosidase family glycoside hydrolase n=1 Tax=Kribbella qitaiheensis TaxID=1544730 RepID=UPI00361781D0
MVWRAQSPVPAAPQAALAFDDDFDAGELAPDWEWNHAPRIGSWTLADGLVLRASRPLRSDDLRAVPSTLTRRLLGTAGSTASIRLHTDDFADEQTAGLGVLCRRSSSITVTREGDLFRLATTGEHSATGPLVESGPLWLQLVIDERDYVTYAYSLDCTTFDPLGNTDTASWSDYRGARIALFSTAPTDDAGTARFDTFRYRIHLTSRR